MNNNKSVYDIRSNMNNGHNAASSIKNLNYQNFPKQYQQNKPFSYSSDSRDFPRKNFYQNQQPMLEKRNFPYKAIVPPQAPKQAFNKFDSAKAYHSNNSSYDVLNRNSNYKPAAPASSKNIMTNINNYNRAGFNKQASNNEIIKMEISNGFSQQQPSFQKPQTQSIWDMRKEIYSQKLAQEEFEREKQMSESNHLEAFGSFQSSLSVFYFNNNLIFKFAFVFIFI